MQGAAYCGALVFGLSGLAARGAGSPAEPAEAAVPAPVEAVPAAGVPAAPAPTGVIPAVTPAVPPALPPPLDPSMPVPPTQPAGAPVDPFAPVPPAANGDFETPITMAGAPAEGVARIGEMPDEAVGFNVQPSGYSGAGLEMAKVDRLLKPLSEGLSLSASLFGTYDSSPTQGYGTGSDDGDFFATLGGSVGYQSKASELTFGGAYSGSYSAYADQTDLDAYSQSFRFWSNYEGGPFSANLNVGFGTGDAANRYYGAVVQETSINYALSGRYRLSEKTVISANVAQTFTNADGNFTDTGSLTTEANVLWR